MEAHTLDKKQYQLLRRDRIEVLGMVLDGRTDHALDKLAWFYLLIHPGIVQLLELFFRDWFQPCQDDIVEKNVCRWIMRLRDRHPILDHSIIPSLLRYLIQIDTITRINELHLLGRWQKRLAVAWAIALRSRVIGWLVPSLLLASLEQRLLLFLKFGWLRVI